MLVFGWTNVMMIPSLLLIFTYSVGDCWMIRRHGGVHLPVVVSTHTVRDLSLLTGERGALPKHSLPAQCLLTGGRKIIHHLSQSKVLWLMLFRMVLHDVPVLLARHGIKHIPSAMVVVNMDIIDMNALVGRLVRPDRLIGITAHPVPDIRDLVKDIKISIYQYICPYLWDFFQNWYVYVYPQHNGDLHPSISLCNVGLPMLVSLLMWKFDYFRICVFINKSLLKDYIIIWIWIIIIDHFHMKSYLNYFKGLMNHMKNSTWQNIWLLPYVWNISWYHNV